MFTIGNNSKLLITETIINPCSNCSGRNTVKLSVYQKYVHFFGIPYWPVKKISVSQCSHCKQVLEEEEMPSSLQIQSQELKRKVKTPLYMYSGIGVFVLLIGYTIFQQIQTDKQNEILIQSPRVGDILEVNAKQKEYTLCKVIKVSGDSVFLVSNQFVADREEGFKDLLEKGDTAYADFTSFVLKEELLHMVKVKQILKVIRKN